jgi:hypothetical protein
MMVGHQVRWAGATDNYHAEFHHDEHVARAQGLPGIILSGPLFGSLLLTQAIKWLGGRAQLKTFQNRNSRPTMPRDTVVIHGRVNRAYREAGENRDSEIPRRVQDGAVVLEGELPLPEGTMVTVVHAAAPRAEPTHFLWSGSNYHSKRENDGHRSSKA